jgi:hypothetical protein
MRYNCEISIHKPLAEVIAKFNKPENLKHWQPGFQSMEHLSGNPGEPGAKSKLLYVNGKRRVELIETITVNNLPHEFTAQYEAPGIWNSVRNLFSEPSPGITHWESQIEFKLSGFMIFFGIIFPGAFKKQSLKFMQLFKKFCESPEA